MKESNKIEILEEKVAELWEDLKSCDRCLDRVTEYGIEKEIKIFEECVGEARARWATANTILKFLKDEIKAEDL
ncbi:MAG: hypothetical protein J6Q75_07320 [Bacteroidaceae bacterium]|nr:hypothetical protein [Bacteroidaceae bacterium]